VSPPHAFDSSGYKTAHRRSDGVWRDTLHDVLDEVNRRLLAELQRDARVTNAELGRRLNLSAPAVGERIARLERTGVIRGYHADVDPKALGYTVAALVRVAPASTHLEDVKDVARTTPEVVECHRVTGEDCFVLTLHLQAIDDLESILDRFTPYGRTTTSIIHSSPVPLRPLPVDSPQPGDG
jgi:Lrp/AsnC family transcriptional regulator, leucine-responsive regulatory protein